MRGYFAVGVEGMSKARNLGAIMRTAHAFGGAFIFTLGAANSAREMYQSDTAKTADNLPYYDWGGLDDLILPRGCQLVGVELTDEAVDLPSFRHPHAAAYVFGRERGDLSPALLARCAHVVKIPTKFCVNVSVACAVTLYDRALSMGGFPARPISSLNKPDLKTHTWGPPKKRTPD